MHRLLSRQLKRHVPDGGLCAELSPLLDAVSAAYQQADDDRGMLERTLELSSQELLQANTDMQVVLRAFPDLFLRIDAAGSILGMKEGEKPVLCNRDGDVKGRRLDEVLDPPLARRFLAALAEVRSSGHAVTIEVERRLEGTSTPFEVRFLPLLADQAMVIVRDTSHQRAAKEAFRQAREIETAAHIQTVMLPAHVAVPGYDVAAVMTPATEVGGDFYDHQCDLDGRHWLSIGDVTGHGLMAGLVMMIVQTTFEILVSDSRRSPAPRDVYLSLNRLLHRFIKERLGLDLYVSGIVLQELGGGKIRYSGAHEEMLVYRRRAGRVERRETTGGWLGFFPDISGCTNEASLLLEPGDVLLLYTDGITEAVDAAGAQFGVERLAAVLAESSEATAAEVVRHVMDSVDAWSPQQSDDRTCVVMRRVHAKGDVGPAVEAGAAPPETIATVRPARFQLEVPPSWSHVGNVRRFLGATLTETGLSRRDVERLTMVTSELMENAVKYATGSRISITLAVEAHPAPRATVTVANDTDDRSAANLEAILADVMQGDPEEAFHRRLDRAATAPGVSQMGLARIRLEGEASLRVLRRGGYVSVGAEHRLDEERTR